MARKFWRGVGLVDSRSGAARHPRCWCLSSRRNVARAVVTLPRRRHRTKWVGVILFCMGKFKLSKHALEWAEGPWQECRFSALARIVTVGVVRLCPCGFSVRADGDEVKPRLLGRAASRKPLSGAWRGSGERKRLLKSNPGCVKDCCSLGCAGWRLAWTSSHSTEQIGGSSSALS